MESSARMKDDRGGAAAGFPGLRWASCAAGPRCSIGQHLLNTGARYCLPTAWQGSANRDMSLCPAGDDLLSCTCGGGLLHGLPGPSLRGIIFAQMSGINLVHPLS